MSVCVAQVTGWFTERQGQQGWVPVLGVLNEGKTEIIPTEASSPFSFHPGRLCPKELEWSLQPPPVRDADFTGTAAARTLVPNCLRLQLDQGFNCGNGLVRKSRSSTTCSFKAKADSENQWAFQELVLELSFGMKNAPQLEAAAVTSIWSYLHPIGSYPARPFLSPSPLCSLNFALFLLLLF
ncbi:hypothetical protein P7K49_016467 [Saguinus oedipus]|uniref:Uncharacterized protein n=1 Tax=Saguinus oedipus TaxID=9490 RepID=A0ABQ9VC57_SAGOE|nr:hypothetical protein P7K49_016467 [Saguinus oedipus]